MTHVTFAAWGSHPLIDRQTEPFSHTVEGPRRQRRPVRRTVGDSFWIHGGLVLWPASGVAVHAQGWVVETGRLAW